MHIHSPLIQRLLTMSQQYEEEISGVILWVRYYNKSTRSFLPYVCLGRLGYVSHVEDLSSYAISSSAPCLSFIFTLRDYESLIRENGKNFFSRTCVAD